MKWSFLISVALLLSISNIQNTSALLPIIWIQNSEWGFFVAVAIPLDLPHRSVFVSYNFEANYYLLYNETTIIPGPLTRLDIQREYPQDAKTIGTNSTEVNSEVEDTESSKASSKVVSKTGRKKTSRKKSNAKKVEVVENQDEGQSHRKVVRMAKTPFVTRKGFYKILRTHMNKAGYPGRQCLLRMICDAAADPLGMHNGVFGDIIHIILTPSSSKDEYLHKDYYIAENMGLTDGCSSYQKMCPESVLDLISQVTEEFIRN